MNARRKLNLAYVNGAIVLAAIIGGLTSSWTIFGLSLLVLLAAGYYQGDIRGNRPR